jgi:hypothetical protein
MPNLLLFLLFTFYQTADYKIDLGRYYDKQKQEKAQGYVETFTVIAKGDLIMKRQGLIRLETN